MRTLVLGIPLPHASFDNYSFISAPSFPDYDRMIVDTAAVSQVVEEAAAGLGQHKTYDGQPVLSGPTSADGFGLADLLAMRRRETERFLARGGVLVCIAYPDVAHSGLGRTEWRRYAWLPAPEGFRYQEHLLPGFGKQGVILEDASHPFAPYIQAFAPRLAYRAYVDEDAPGFVDRARVFARSAGGLAIGVELAVGPGRVILLPPLTSFEQERAAMAEALFECLERWRNRLSPDMPDWMRKEVS